MIVPDGGQVEADVSLQHPTRLSLKYDGGDQLIFNQPEGTTPEIAATVDDKGDVYLSVIEGHPGQMVSGFLTTEGGRTYLVRLTVKEKPADQYVIVSQEARDEAEAAKAAKSVETAKVEVQKVEWNKGASYHDNMSGLMRTLCFVAGREGFEQKKRRETKQVEGLTMTSHRTWTSENMEAIIYDVRNDNNYFIDPSANVRNYRPYVAVSFTSDALDAGETGRIYLLRKKER